MHKVQARDSLAPRGNVAASVTPDATLFALLAKLSRRPCEEIWGTGYMPLPRKLQSNISLTPSTSARTLGITRSYVRDHSGVMSSHEYLAVAAKAAREAGKIIMEAWDKPRKVEHKKAVDLVRLARKVYLSTSRAGRLWRRSGTQLSVACAH